MALTMFRYIQTSQRAYCTNFLPKMADDVRRSKRLNPLIKKEVVFDLPRPNSDTLKYSFFYTAYDVWKSLPNYMRVMMCLDTFRVHLFNYLFLND